MSSDAAPPALVDDATAQPGYASAVVSAPVGDVDTAAAGGQPIRRPAAELVRLHSQSIDAARAAAVAEAGSADHVGEFVSAVAEDDVAVTAGFAARQPGYVGWQWSVTLAVLEQGSATVSEVVLLPGEGSLLAPAWIPWDQRIRAGDVGVGDLLPPIEDDPRLVPAYVQSDDPAVEAVARELGVGRVHVLSREGRVDFAERLHGSTFGPTGEVALAAPAHCFSCAFYLPLAGSLGQLVGACSNEYSPADGRVVGADFGCGAHSETVIDMPARSAATLAVIDELSLEVHRRPAPANLGAAEEHQLVEKEIAPLGAAEEHPLVEKEIAQLGEEEIAEVIEDDNVSAIAATAATAEDVGVEVDPADEVDGHRIAGPEPVADVAEADDAADAAVAGVLSTAVEGLAAAPELTAEPVDPGDDAAEPLHADTSADEDRDLVGRAGDSTSGD